MSKGWYTLGVVTDHSRCTCQATSFSNTVRRHVAATNHFVCTGEFCENLCLRNIILSLQQVAKNQIGLNLSDLLQQQRFSQKLLQYTWYDFSYFILVRILYKQKTSQKKGGLWFPLDHPLIRPWLLLFLLFLFFLF